MTSFLKVFYALLALNVVSYVAAWYDDIILGEVYLRGDYEFARFTFFYSVDECIEQGYCSDNITTQKELLYQVGTLTPSFLTETLSTYNTTFKLLKNHRGIIVPMEVFMRRTKYIAMIIIYSIVTIGLFLVHHFKQHLSIEFEFKFSKLSKLMLNYLAFKTVLKFIYLALMFAYVDLYGRISSRSGLFYLILEDYIQGPVTFALAVLFAMGYGTRKFKIDASMAWKTLLLTACNVFVTLPVLLREIPKNRHIFDSDGLFLTVLYCGLIYVCCYIGYNTYKVDRDQRYVESAKAILYGVFLNTFFIVPKSLWDTKILLFEHVVKSKNESSQGVAIPDLIELVVIIYLIYVWRDIRDEELGSIQLENIEI